MDFQGEWPPLRVIQTYELLADRHAAHWPTCESGAFENILSFLMSKLYETFPKHSSAIFSFDSDLALGTVNVVRITSGYDAICDDLTLAAEEYCFEMTSYDHDASD